MTRIDIEHHRALPVGFDTLGSRCSSVVQAFDNRSCDRSSDRTFLVDQLVYFTFQLVIHYWFNKGRGMYYSVCGMMHIKEPLLLIGKSSPCGGSGFPLSLFDWSFTICLMP